MPHPALMRCPTALSGGASAWRWQWDTLSLFIVCFAGKYQNNREAAATYRMGYSYFKILDSCAQVFSIKLHKTKLPLVHCICLNVSCLGGNTYESTLGLSLHRRLFLPGAPASSFCQPSAADQ